ncbi:glycosyltransferase [Sphingomonas sp. LB-2]|uniref:glycosyltransferase n=1 Tax=Sphingomonas caeni TaxID=2984949 RepID=UPI00222FE2F9|nr:glycosyltransferase [Sphingomonas caeni]MCW3849350.1 glycosyltransferase [Sphingomonas caeni]
MRIAYLTEWPPYAESGVLRKMVGQIAAWRAAGHDAEIFTVVPPRDAPTAPGFAEHGRVIGSFTQAQLDRYPKARLGFLNKIVSVPKLRAALKAFAPDIVYYRQNGPWYPGLGSILRAWPSVAEINTYEGAENALWGGTFRRFQEATRRRVLGSVGGFVCMTQEIADHEAWAKKPAAIIGNPLWADPLDPVPTGNSEPEFVFTGSPMTLGTDANWHGVDKLFPLAAAMPKSRFNIAGMEAKDFPGAPANMAFHGMLDAAALSTLYARCDIGFGTLALHRKTMEEACPLKVRDYLMHRLAVVIGYREAQAELNTAPYVLPIGNAEDNVAANIGRIIAFAREWTNRRVIDDLTFLTGTAIEAHRLEFLASVAARHGLHSTGVAGGG